MAKPKKEVPAVKAYEIDRYIQNKMIQREFLNPVCPIMIVLKRARITQHWIIKNKENVVSKMSARISLKKGIFLCPKWQIVAKWQIDYYKEMNQDLKELGIYYFETDTEGEFCDEYKQLVYMQVDRLDSAYRQPLHVVSNYFDKVNDYLLFSAYSQDRLLQASRIISIMKNRLFHIRSFSIRFKNNLIKNQKMIEAIANRIEKNRPHLKERYIDEINKVVDYCVAIKSRPMNRLLNYAKRSLIAAIKYIELDDYKRAEKHLRKALTNMSYPKPAK